MTGRRKTRTTPARRAARQAPGNPNATESLVADNLELATRIARRFSRAGKVDEDLVQVARMGLYLAARRYDPAAGPFRPFAAATISGECKKHLRNVGWSARVPRSVQERSLAVERAAERLQQRLGRSPTPAEVGEVAGMSVEEVLEARHARESTFAGPLPADDEPTDQTDGDTSLVLAEVLDGLEARHRRILRLRFHDELSQREIAGRLGVSQTTVHRMLSSANAAVRGALDDVGFER